MVVKNGQLLPPEVVSACGIHGIRLTDVVDYRVGEEFVTIINVRGQKFTAELVKLNPPTANDAKVTANDAKGSEKRETRRPRKRPSRAQKVLVDVPGKIR